MWKTQLCLGLMEHWDMDFKEQMLLYKNVGFDGFFVSWNRERNIKELKTYADEIGMLFQSIHAPFTKSAAMWKEGAVAEEAVQELLDCVKDCAANQIPIMVCHCFMGEGEHHPNEIGVRNFHRIIRKAEELGVRIAFENCELEQFLAVIMEAFEDYRHVGFCWDTGHEMCYNHGQDMMALYGDRIFCTHLNDNLGIRDFDGNITWIDDLHLLPFDGIADWENIAKRLNKYNYHDVLTFELMDDSKPGRHENDVYGNMGRELYVTEAYKRACKVAAFKIKENKGE